jgi:vacuolar-type H+-ATPase subunit D/Vma8
VLTAIKERYAAAKTGHDLLKRKSDAIKVNLNNILKKILVVSRTAGQKQAPLRDKWVDNGNWRRCAWR